MKIRDLITLPQDELIVVDGIITQRMFLPFFLPGFVSIDETGQENWLKYSLSFNTHIEKANHNQKHHYRNEYYQIRS